MMAAAVSLQHVCESIGWKTKMVRGQPDTNPGKLTLFPVYLLTNFLCAVNSFEGAFIRCWRAHHVNFRSKLCNAAQMDNAIVLKRNYVARSWLFTSQIQVCQKMVLILIEQISGP